MIIVAVERGVLLTTILVAAALGALGWAGPVTAPASDATPPRGRPPVGEGQPGGSRSGARGTSGRRAATAGGRSRVPHDWNARETRTNRSGVGWYRRDFTLPRKPGGTRWVVRFEGAGHHATVYLNGRVIARHAGDYVPFEAELKGLRRGTNRLDGARLVRARPLGPDALAPGPLQRPRQRHVVELRRHPPRGVGAPGAATWTSSAAQALPRQDCAGCPARVEVRTLVHNLTGQVRRARVGMTVEGRRVVLPTRAIAPGARQEIVGQFTIARPRLVGHRPGRDVPAGRGRRRGALHAGALPHVLRRPRPAQDGPRAACC